MDHVWLPIESWLHLMAASGVSNEEQIAGIQEAAGGNVRIVQISGLVKWFDVGRGYGFIIPDNGMQDILLHLSCLKRDGFDAPLEGTRSVCRRTLAGRTRAGVGLSAG